MIEIMNLKYVSQEYPFDFRIDRKTVLGNPFILRNEEDRDKVCDRYEKWFYNNKDIKFQDQLAKLIEVYKEYGKLRLFCWCAPKRCHGETIRSYVLMNYIYDKHQEAWELLKDK